MYAEFLLSLSICLPTNQGGRNFSIPHCCVNPTENHSGASTDPRGPTAGREVVQSQGAEVHSAVCTVWVRGLGHFPALVSSYGKWNDSKDNSVGLTRERPATAPKGWEQVPSVRTLCLEVSGPRSALLVPAQADRPSSGRGSQPSLHTSFGFCKSSKPPNTTKPHCVSVRCPEVWPAGVRAACRVPLWLEHDAGTLPVQRHLARCGAHGSGLSL